MQKMDNSIRHNGEENEEIVQAELVEEVEPGTPWEWREVRPVRPRQRRVRLPVLLFVATCLSTLATGVVMSVPPSPGWWAALLNGLWYAAPVMTILICHEMGHFIQSYRHGVYASWPYFLPFPVPGSPLGTLGAVIVMEPRIGHRKALFDIGVTGPLAGLVPTFIFLIVGLRYSTIEKQQFGYGMHFGEPLVFRFLVSHILGPVRPGMEVITHPTAFAGWVGLLITSLNLMPIGQLDGGHVLYALLRRKANKVASLLLLSAIVIVALDFNHLGMWTLMLILLVIMKPTHPPTADDDEPLGIVRTIIGWLTLAFIVIGFTPTPIVQM